MDLPQTSPQKQTEATEYVIDMPDYTLGEEVANSVIHGIGILLAIAALAVLTGFAARTSDPWVITSCAVYGFTLILLYGASTVYHAIPPGKAKKVLRVVDHASIFLLIAGTYTPFTLVSLRGPWGWTLFGVVWGLALFGVIFQTTLLKRFKSLSVVLYVLMGWAVVIAIRPLLESLPLPGFLWLLCGGLAYTLGVIFFVWERLPYNHAIWHVFVLAGSIMHFFAVLFYVIP